jgi:hypothetical protein
MVTLTRSGGFNGYATIYRLFVLTTCQAMRPESKHHRQEHTQCEAVA